MHPVGCSERPVGNRKVPGGPVDCLDLPGRREAGAKPGWVPAEADATVAAPGLVGGCCPASPECGGCPRNGWEPGLVGSNTETEAESPGMAALGCPGRATW
jgi:hypothetical protein